MSAEQDDVDLAELEKLMGATGVIHGIPVVQTAIGWPTYIECHRTGGRALPIPIAEVLRNGIAIEVGCCAKVLGKPALVANLDCGIPHAGVCDGFATSPRWGNRSVPRVVVETQRAKDVIDTDKTIPVVVGVEQRVALAET